VAILGQYAFSGKPSICTSRGTGRTEGLKLNSAGEGTPSQAATSPALASAVESPTNRMGLFI